jgi:hypothetical protein
MRRVLITAVALLALAPAGAVAWQGDDNAGTQDDEYGAGSDVVKVYRGTVVSVGGDGTIVADVRTRACPGRGAAMGPEDLPDSPASDSNTGTTTQMHFGGSGGGGAADQQYGGDEGGPRGGQRGPRGGGRGGRGGPSDRGRGKPARLVDRRLTFKTDADTTVYRNGDDAVVSAIQAGDTISVSLLVDEDTTEAEALAEPAWIVSAYSASTSYGFAGKITAIDTTAGTLTVDVKKSTKNGKAVITGLGASTVTFATGTNTAITRNGKKVALSGLAVGDLAAVGIRAGKAATPQEVVGTPASSVLALTKSKTTTTSALKYAKRAAKKAKK